MQTAASSWTSGARASFSQRLVDDPAGAVDLARDRQREADVGAERAPRRLAVGPVAGHRLLVAVEDEADDLERLVQRRAAGIPAGDVVGADEIDGHRRVLRGEL